MIPNILTMGVAGYPFIIPGILLMIRTKDTGHIKSNNQELDSSGAIGGDFWPVGKSNASYRMSSEGSFRVPDRDLYMYIYTTIYICNSNKYEYLFLIFSRWLELVHFLPVVQYSFLPSDYDQKVVDIATNMYFTRKNKLYPYIKKAIDQSLTTGLPVIRYAED